jgi:hypothetical protein
MIPWWWRVLTWRPVGRRSAAATPSPGQRAAPSDVLADRRVQSPSWTTPRGRCASSPAKASPRRRYDRGRGRCRRPGAGPPRRREIEVERVAQDPARACQGGRLPYRSGRCRDRPREEPVDSSVPLSRHDDDDSRAAPPRRSGRRDRPVRLLPVGCDDDLHGASAPRRSNTVPEASGACGGGRIRRPPSGSVASQNRARGTTGFRRMTRERTSTARHRGVKGGIVSRSPAPNSGGSPRRGE